MLTEQQLQEMKEGYSNMDWDGFRECAGDLITREIEIYDAVVIEGVPALIAEVERLREALEFYADEKNHTEPRGTQIFGDVFYDKGIIARKALDGEQ